MIKVYYPTKSFLTTKEKAIAWYPYILKGFQDLEGVQVEFSEKMSELSSAERGNTVTVFQVDIDGKKQTVFYDWCDFMVDHQDVAQISDALYFKIQAYDNLIPIGQTVTNLKFFNQLDRLRSIKDKKKYDQDIIGLFSTRNDDRRIKSCQIIRNMKDIKSLVGVQRRSPKHDVPNNLLTKKLEYFQHLEMQCKSKLCLVLSGVGNRCAFSWRLTEALAMGCAVITHEHVTKYPQHKKFEKNCIITVKKDLSDLEEKIRYYLQHDEEREKIAKNGREYFEKYLTPTSMAERIIEMCIAKGLINEVSDTN